MKKINLDFDFLHGPIVKEVYDIQNDRLVTGIEKLDNDEKIKDLDDKICSLYSSFYNESTLSNESSLDLVKIREHIDELYALKVQLISEIKRILPDCEIVDETKSFFDKYLLSSAVIN